MHEVGQSVFVEIETVDVAKRFHDLGINLRKRVEQRKAEIAQAHADFVVHRGLGQAHFVGLPERSDFGADIVFAVFRFFRRERKTVEAFQLLRDATSLQQNGLPRDLGGMRREDRSDRDLTERGDGILRRNSSLFHAQQCSAKRTGQRRDVRDPICRRGGGACGDWSRRDW